jgi:serine phosphatase RsbU (regulator of sigma subunit)
LLIGVDRKKLIIQNKSQDKNEFSTGLVKRFSIRGIESARFERGVSGDDIKHFIDLLTAPADDVLEENELAEHWIEPLDRIQINDVDVEYTTLSPEFDPNDHASDESEEQKDDEQDKEASIPVNESDVRKLQQLLSCDPGPEMLHKWVKTFREEHSSSPSTYLRTVLKLIHQTVDKDHGEDSDISLDTVRRLLMHTIIHIQLNEGTTETEIRNLMTSSENQPDTPDTSEILKQNTESPFDELFNTIPRSSQGRILAHELRGGRATSSSIYDVVETCSPRGRELVEVISSAVDEMSHFISFHSEGSGSSAFGRLMNAVLENSPYQPPSRTILIADDDGEYDQYLLYLSQDDGYIDHHTSGTEAWRAICSSNSPDLLILEIKLPGKTGLEMIDELSSRSSPPPILVCTRYPQFQDAFEIMTYPNIEFLDKPVPETDFRNAIDTLLPSKNPPEDQPDLYAPDELDRAREMNERMMKSTLPDMPADFELSRYHRSAERIGGDYLDVIPKGEHRYLLTLARVSGWGVSSTLVKLLLRNCLYFLKEQCETVRNMLIKLNQFIKNEIDQPMHANVLLGLLDTADTSIQLASAGHSSSMFWNNKKGNTSNIDLTGISVGQVDSNRFAKYLSDHHIQLNNGDGLALYSGGQNTNKTHQERSSLREVIDETAFVSAARVSEQFADRVEHDSDGDEARDDLSLLTIRRSDDG